MIKLKELIKEETKHVCECGGDCCKTSVNESLDLPKDMELGKVFTGQGKAFMKEEDLNEKKNPKREKIKKDFKTSLKFAKSAIRKIDAFMKSDYWGMVDGFVTDKRTGLVSIVNDMEKSMNQIINMPVDESVNEEWTLYTTTQYGKKLQKLKSYKSRKAATIALGKLSAKLDTPRFPKNVDGLMIIDEAFKNESVNEAKKYSDDWNLTKRVTSNFIKQNLKSVDNSIKKKDGEGLRFHLNQIIKVIQNAKRALKLESVNEKMDKEQFHDYMQYVLKTQFKTPEEKKMKKSIIKKLNIANKKKGLRLFKEAVEPKGNMAKIAKVVTDKQYTKLSGVLIDGQSANLLMKLFNAVSDKDKEKMNKLNAKMLTTVIKRLWSRVNLKLPI